MPQILEIKEIDGAAWVRIGKPGEFPSGVALWTPDEQVAAAKAAAGAERERIAFRLQYFGQWRAIPFLGCTAIDLADIPLGCAAAKVGARIYNAAFDADRGEGNDDPEAA